MEHKPPLLPNHYYHIYNRGNNRTRIFFSREDYDHFIQLMKIFLVPVADVYSYALMSNHLHIALRVKAEDEIGWLNPINADSNDLTLKWLTSTGKPIGNRLKKPASDKMIQHLFSSHSKWINARNHVTGNLMEDRFERKLVSSFDQLRRLVCYININPQKHRVSTYSEYQWTSYHLLIGDGPSWLSRDFILELFGDREAFILALKETDFDDWLEEREG